jgi:hypothetical protein
LLESLGACAGVTLGQIAKAMEADFWRHGTNEKLEIVADKLSAAGVIAGPLPGREPTAL